MDHSGEANEMVGKMTAVEWLIGQLHKTRDWQRVINEANESSSSVRDVIKEAKEKEKEQIINANRDGVDMVVDKKDFISGEQYYKETYGGNK